LKTRRWLDSLAGATSSVPNRKRSGSHQEPEHPWRGEEQLPVRHAGGKMVLCPFEASARSRPRCRTTPCLRVCLIQMVREKRHTLHESTLAGLSPTRTCAERLLWFAEHPWHGEFPDWHAGVERHSRDGYGDHQHPPGEGDGPAEDGRARCGAYSKGRATLWWTKLPTERRGWHTQEWHW